jgi:hypothetical protein
LFPDADEYPLLNVIGVGFLCSSTTPDRIVTRQSVNDFVFTPVLKISVVSDLIYFVHYKSVVYAFRVLLLPVFRGRWAIFNRISNRTLRAVGKHFRKEALRPAIGPIT